MNGDHDHPSLESLIGWEWVTIPLPFTQGHLKHKWKWVGISWNALPPFQNKVTFGHKIRYEINVTFGEISIRLHQTTWNVVKNNVNVVVDELPSQKTVYNCLKIDIWTHQCRCTSTRFCVLQCHPPKLVGFQWNWRQKFLTLLWTPLARRKALSESYATHAVLC